MLMETVKRMANDDVDRELRRKFTRPGSRLIRPAVGCGSFTLTDHDIDVLDKQTKRDILAH